jgi:hypothetical protein
MSAVYERRYHATWVTKHGCSPLADLATWLCDHPGALDSAPLDLLCGALSDVTARLPSVAAREPTRRHLKHFSWLLGWQSRIAAVLDRGCS